MLELWQTEWCPASQRVRERLTELGIDYLTRQVPVDKEQRTALLAATGSDTIPALVLEDGTALDRRGRDPTLPRRARRRAARRRGTPTEGGQSAPPLPGGGMRMLATGYTLSATTELAIRRGGRARPRRAQSRRLRRPLRDRRPGDPEGEARRRRRALRDPRRLQPAARPPGARGRARPRHPAALQRRRLPNATARRTSPRSTPSECSRSSATTSSRRSRPKCARGWPQSSSSSSRSSSWAQS